jgi:hypothetical protein
VTLNQCVKDVDVLGRDCSQKNAIPVPGKADQSERASTAKTSSTSVTPSISGSEVIVMHVVCWFLPAFPITQRGINAFRIPSFPL